MQEEESLVIKLQEQDDAAYRRLFQLFKDRVYNTCLSMLQRTAEAEDITQEVFVEVFRSIGKFKGSSALSTWIYRITVNKCLEQMRRGRRKKRMGKIISLFEPDSSRPIVEPPDFQHPGIALEQKETGIALFTAMNKLPERQKTAFILFHVEDLSYKEICEVMKLSLPSVESLLHRAKNNMKSLLEKGSG